MNSLSNRSHIQITIKIANSARTMDLTFLDLAGKERILSTGVSKQVLDEVVGINKSLGSLEDVL